MKPLTAAVLIIATSIAACNKNSGNNPGGGGGGGGGPVSISSMSPDYVFWGEQLTINGAGFSTNANENIVYIKGNKVCDPDTTWQKATVVSATSTKLVVKVPFVTKTNGVKCGHDYAYARVTVGNKSVTSTNAVKFVGPLEISLCHPFGITIGNYPNTYRPGDSSVMTAHLHTLYGRESGFYDKIKLYVNGTQLNAVDRYWQGATCGGYTFVLDPAAFCDLNNCDVPSGSSSDPARKFTFIAKIEGTSFADTTECYVFNQPNMVITGKEGPASVSKSGVGNPTVKLKGKHMYFTQVRWTSNQPTFHTAAPAVNLNATELGIFIPLSLMVENESYTATGILPCGKTVTLFSIGITP